MPLTVESAARKDRTSGNGSVRLEHRHFAFIAATIASMPGDIERRIAAIHFAHECAATNPKFDRARFLAACGI